GGGLPGREQARSGRRGRRGAARAPAGEAEPARRAHGDRAWRARRRRALRDRRRGLPRAGARGLQPPARRRHRELPLPLPAAPPAGDLRAAAPAPAGRRTPCQGHRALHGPRLALPLQLHLRPPRAHLGEARRRDGGEPGRVHRSESRAAPGPDRGRARRLREARGRKSPAWLRSSALRMRVLGVAIALLAAIAGSCGGGHEVGRRGPQLVILGFDGVDPHLLSRWMEEGKLPRLRALAERGDFRRLASTNPPQSPVAWTTFATGTGPGRHGIFDFIERDPATYLPDVGTGGGRLVALSVTGDEAHADVPGPADPRGGGRPALTLPLRLRVDRAGDAVTIAFADRQTRVARGAWSPWLAFRVPVVAPLGLPLVALDGLCRFHVLSIDPLRVYLSPLNYAPVRPFAPISAPGAFAGELARALGPYKTVGWSEDTSALNAERVDEQAFLDDLDQTMDEVRASTLRELARPDWDLLVSVFTQTDRVAHMFYRFLDPAHPRYDAVLAARFGDAVQRVYQRMDGVVGEVLERLGPEAVLLVLSDHGFHSYRTGLNVNTWLRDRGYLVQA